MVETTRYMTTEVIAALRREIEENRGAELFAVLRRGEGEQQFTQVSIVCRGTHTEVPALISRTQAGDMTVHNHPSGVLQPSRADMAMATLFGEEGVGSMIVNNEVSHCIVVAEPAADQKKVDVATDEVAAILGPEGALSRKLPNYESREGQVAMATSVAKALNEEHILSVEAGTGTGKSLAYLIPAMLWSKHNRDRIVIATKTIALQEQLVNKDIPLAQSVIPDPPRAALIKGRGNYVCLRKMADVRSHQMALFTDEERDIQREVEDLAAWVEETGKGDLADLPFMPSRESWDLIRSDADMCLGAKCPFFQRAPFYESRRRAAQSRILVVNQALLFADLAVRQQSDNYKTAAVMPSYGHVILDEAHSMEDIATDHFGNKVSSLGLRFLLAKFFSNNRGSKGVLSRLLNVAVDGAANLARVLGDELLPEYTVIQDEVVQQIHALSRALHNQFNPEGKRNVLLWLRNEILGSGELDEAKAEAARLMELLHRLMLVVKNVRTHLENQSEAFLDQHQGICIELAARMSRVEDTLSTLKYFAIRQDPNHVPWLELKISRRFEEFEYRVSPLDVSGTLREALFQPFKSVVMTSATLDLKDEFRFFTNRNGLAKLEDKKQITQSFASPFDYARQAGLCLVRMSSGPTHPAFADDLAGLILKTALSPFPGGTLVLFTAYAQMNIVARTLEQPLAQAGVALLVQGREQRSVLVEKIKKNHGVLLGTDSFWEGIDLPGHALTKVIIAKLPFRQMRDPIFEARCTAIEADGRSSFSEYSLPLALLKFKQGVGRLIRTKEDRGVLIIADNRILNKGYGKRFLSLVDAYPRWELTQAQLVAQLHGEQEVRGRG
ncbi:Helicase ATP-binding domain-containing protein [Sulfidibacter corallicola]|uniref:Helicase ATP-binding domain-containing protein n=1 Tax=Sulfidibacter corallicola TaxID=2818388 RepID=A0A8A4TVB1_SULCO|nr:helicase C-terminal domain-containing protein [Sulfidibacter corallicola]QTD53896.1 hypothetical protein J3U87_15720 [Sulfidibacter corallicola]